MNDLNRMENHYKERKKDLWSLFNCYPFFTSCKQTYILTKILKNKNIETSTILDIGAGNGNFILKLLSLGATPKNITAIEYLKERFDILVQNLPSVTSYNADYLEVESNEKYQIITLMAVLTSITDNEIRYRIFNKSLNELGDKGMLILYDYFQEDEKFLNQNYRALSLRKIQELTHGLNFTVYKKVYIKSKYAYILCKLRLGILIPLLEQIKIFNDNYHFVVIEK